MKPFHAVSDRLDRSTITIWQLKLNVTSSLSSCWTINHFLRFFGFFEDVLSIIFYYLRDFIADFFFAILMKTTDVMVFFIYIRRQMEWKTLGTQTSLISCYGYYQFTISLKQIALETMKEFLFVTKFSNFFFEIW